MTNNKQKTAVDILCGKLAMKLGIPQAMTFYIDHQEEIREAKEMDKEIMIDFAFNALKIADNTRNRYVDVDKLYKELFGGGEQ